MKDYILTDAEIDEINESLVNCPTDRDWDLYWAGKLDPKRKAEIDTHAKGCDICDFLSDYELQKE